MEKDESKRDGPSKPPLFRAGTAPGDAGDLRAALEESEQRSAEVAALLRASRAVLESHRFGDAARAIFDAYKTLVGAQAGYVALLSEDGTRNELVFLDAGDLPCTVDASLPMPIRGLRAEAYRTGKAVYDNGFAGGQWAKYLPPGHAPLGNVLFAPLVLDGEAMGLLGLANKPGGFTADDARLATAFGELAAIALRNSRTLESLAASEERFRSVAETASDAIICVDSEGTIILWNRAAEAIFGHSAAAAVGKPLELIIPERFRGAHRTAMRRLVETGKGTILGRTVEVTGLRKDGSEVPVELSLASWRTRERLFVTGIVRDITERWRAREEIERQNAFLNMVLDSLTYPFYVVDARDHTVTVANRACGLREPSKATTCYALAHHRTEPCGPDGCPCPLEQVKRTKKPVVVEHVHYDADGEPRHVEVYGYPILDRDGNVVQMIEYCLDITERKRAEREIEDLARFPSENPSPVMRVAGDGSLLYANEASASLVSEWGCGVGERLPEEWRRLVAEALGSGSRRSVEVGHQGRILSFEVAPVPPAGYANLYGRDVTEQRQAERALQQLNAELEQRVRARTAELSEANLRLQAEVAVRREAEESLREAHGLLETIFDNTHVLVACLDPQFHFVRVNRTYAEADDRDPSFFPGRNHFDLYPNAENEAIFRRVVETGRPCFEFAKPFEYAEHPERGVTYWDWSLVPIHDADGAVAGLILTMLDVTRRVRGEEEQARLRERLEALWRVARMVDADHKALCDHVLSEATALTRSRYAFYGFLNDDESVVRIHAWSRDTMADCAMHDKPLEYSVATAGLWGVAVRERRPLIVNDYCADHPGKRGLPEGHTPLERLLVVPVFSHGRIVAIVGLANKRTDYTQEDATQIEAFATSVQVILDRRRAEEALHAHQEQLRSLASELSLAEERERRRIAADLHDGVGQNLAASKMKLGLLRQAVAPGEQAQLLDSTIALIEQTMRDAWSLMFDISPPYLYELGLEAALEWLVEQCQEQQHGMRFEFGDDGQPKPLDDDVRGFVFRAVREMLLNVVEHAQASRATVGIRRVGQQMAITVEDDGVGFQASPSDPEAGKVGGFGLFSIRERLALLGGTLSVDSAPGRGTCVTLTVPLGSTTP